MDRLVPQQPFGARPELIGVAFVVIEPLLEDVVDRDPLPACGVIVVERVDRAQLKNRLRIKSERIGLQPIDRSDRNLSGRCSGGGAGAGRATGCGGARIVERASQSLERHVARQAATDRAQPQRKREATVGERPSRRARVISTSGRPERACEIMRGKTDPRVERRHAEIGPHLGRQPRIGRG